MPARPAGALPAWFAAVAAVAALIGALPAAAGSQSSNSSSNCSDGRCTRVESYDTERGGFRGGWTRIDRWDERPRRRDWDEQRWRGGDRHYHADPYRHHAPRRRHRGRDGHD
jgi:hypothetical protein